MGVPAGAGDAPAAGAGIPGVLLDVEVGIPFVLSWAFQTSAGIVWALMSSSPNVAFASVVPLKPGVVAGVASTLPP